MHRILTCIALLAILMAAWLAPRLDAAATTQVDAGWKRALATFAAARALNAVISVAQGTEIAVQPGGLGVTLAPGQVLEPINDLIEQFSTLMLWASVAFGIQRVLIAVGGNMAISIAISGVALVWAGLRFFRSSPSPAFVTQALLLLLAVRLLVPAVVIGSDAMFKAFMHDDYQAAQLALDRSSADIGQGAPPTTNESPVERIKRWFAQAPDVSKRIGALKEAAEHAAEHMVRLIVVFVLQTMVVPLLLCWALWQLLRAALSDMGGKPAATPNRDASMR